MHAPAVLSLVLLLLLLLPLLGAALDANCTPASCGNLPIRYPFWLRGHQPSYCGYPSFGIACDPTGASAPSLNDSYLRVLDIHYGNRSVVAFHTNLADDPTGCRATRFNMSTSLALSLLAVSRANWELFLHANCSRQPPPAGSVATHCKDSGAWFMYLGRRSYEPGAPPLPGTTGCRFSIVPVLPESPELKALSDYETLVKRGFLVEWTVPGDCAACNASGGQCRFDADVNAFRCHCPDGRRQPATCAPGELLIPRFLTGPAAYVYPEYTNDDWLEGNRFSRH
ncbi:hypothetical protein BS78_03G072900 [Paspalum vaginatum]|nr:hypothetical protein BS78_03G072900 [Paspalum vaginatum]